MTQTNTVSTKNYFSSTQAVLAPMVRAAQVAGVKSLQEQLQDIQRWLSADLVDLEASFLRATAIDADCARKAADHLLRQPGKRVRPLCVLLAARAGGEAMSETVKELAIACELVHSATLLHDDVLDEGRMRRGAEASRVLYGNSASVLGGDYLLIEALRRVRRTGENELLGRLMDVIDGMVRAEAAQLDRRGSFGADADAYHYIIYGKTASIFEWGLSAGARVAGLSQEAIDGFAGYGKAVGMAFQLVDDILDLTADDAALGKIGLADLRDGKLTWPLILATEENPGLERELDRLVKSADDEVDLSSVRAQILATDCIERSQIKARAYGQEARDFLSVVPPSEAREALLTVIDAVIERGL
ncbi:MAG: polyprenyl synthetase family protein [Myxococcota bacterium]|nr:polyprenyl synthetase family protein [Myxococcota bacterium]